MNVAELAARLIIHYSPEERSIPDSADYTGRNAEVLKAINGALQEMFGEGSPWVREDRRGVLLNPPASVAEITVTKGSTSATISVASWQDWFAGCAISINGSAIDNEIRNASRNVVLRFPHDGESGTTSATVFHNSVAVASDVMAVMGKVTANGSPVWPVITADQRSGISEEDYGFHRQATTPIPVITRVGDSLARPIGYVVEMYSPGPTMAPVQRLRLTPAPEKQYVLEYTAKLGPPRVQVISSTDNLPIPFEFVESMLAPIALKRLTESPFFSNPNGLAQIESAYALAKKALKDLTPKKRTGRRFVSPYNA